LRSEPRARPGDRGSKLVARVGELDALSRRGARRGGPTPDEVAGALEPGEKLALPRRRLVEVGENQTLRRKPVVVCEKPRDLRAVDPTILGERGEIASPPRKERAKVALARAGGLAAEIDVPIAAKLERFGGPARGTAVAEQLSAFWGVGDDPPPESERLLRPATVIVAKNPA